VTARFSKALGAFGLVAGAAAAVFYYRRGLTLSHYDAKAHLVVARRILDSLTPEYSQIGAVWLPLPHVLNLLPVQVDAFYRTGASGVAISVLAFAVACYAMAHLVVRVTRSHAAAAFSVALFATNPDVLYLQSTPMTEPLLFGLMLLGVSLVYDWVDAEGRPGNVVPASARTFAARPGSKAGLPAVARTFAAHPRAKAGWVLVAACLTRYEAWFVTAALLALSAAALWRCSGSVRVALKSTAKLAIYPAVAIAFFFFHSWFTTGAWFVTGGFFVPDNIAHGRPLTALMAVVYGIRVLIGTPFAALALIGTAAALWRGLQREYGAALVILGLGGLMALPAYAFYEGHPFRMRYMIAPAVGAIVFIGIALGTLRGRWRRAALSLVAVWLVFTARPLNPQAAMVQEAQWDRPFSIGRKNVTACLMRDYRGEPILASMGSLAHYMQELSQEGIDLRNFVHEGNLPYWQEAVESPKGLVGWILVEERAEGGDILAARTRESSDFLTGFTRVCADGGVALYKSTN
jgi:hypothetical protein